MRLSEEGKGTKINLIETTNKENSIVFYIQECHGYVDMQMWHSEQQGIIAADMVILRGTEKKWVGHVKFMKCLR